MKSISEDTVKMYDPKEFAAHWWYKVHKLGQDRKVKKEFIKRTVRP
jgi:hypothetical protein